MYVCKYVQYILIYSGQQFRDNKVNIHTYVAIRINAPMHHAYTISDHMIMQVCMCGWYIHMHEHENHVFSKCA